jgi:hypothetical protein
MMTSSHSKRANEMPEFAVQRGPLKLNPGANTSNNLIVRFRSQEVPMVRLGQRVFDAVEYVDFVTVQHPGENLSVIDRPVKDEDKRRWPQEWERYQAGKGERVSCYGDSWMARQASQYSNSSAGTRTRSERKSPGHAGSSKSHIVGHHDRD